MAKKLTAEQARKVYRDCESVYRQMAHLPPEVRLQKLHQYWKTVVRCLQPAERESWLKAVGLVVLGAERQKTLLEELNTERQMVQDLAPTPAWVESYESTGEKIPIRVSAIEQLRYERGDQRDFTKVASVNCKGMVLSGCPSRIGETEIVRQRLIPEPCAQMENELDGMDAIEAAGYQAPEYGRPLRLKDYAKEDPITGKPTGLKERKRTLKLRGRDPYRCGWGTIKASPE